MTEPFEWNDLKHSVRIGDLVTGRVIRHTHFGVFVRIDGIPFDGLVQITDFKDEGRTTVDEFPPVGTSLRAIVLGFKETGNQIWLGVKPSQIGTAARPDESHGTRKAIPVGLRLQPDGKVEFFGIDEVNSLVREGARVAELVPGAASLNKVSDPDKSIRPGFDGFSVRVVVETG